MNTATNCTMGLMLLDRNENQYGPAPACYGVLRTANLEQLSLYSRTYVTGKKSELSERISRDTGIAERRVLLSYGSEDMLKQVVHCYLRPGETMLLPKQSWWYYRAIASEVFGNQVLYSLHEHNNYFEYDLEEIMRLYDIHRPRIILIASPNNPTGNRIPLAALNTLVDHCSSSVIVLDEAYHGFSGESNDHVAELLAFHKRIAILRTFSKCYALAGLRIGYALAGEELDQLIGFSARYLGYNQLSEKIALAALDDSAYYQTITRQMREDKESYYRTLGEMDGFVPFISDANFILVRYPRHLKKILEAGLLKRDIVVKFLDDPEMTDCLRITIGTRQQNVHVLSAFGEIMDELHALEPPAIVTKT